MEGYHLAFGEKRRLVQMYFYLRTGLAVHMKTANKKIETAIVQINEKKCENIPNTIDLRLFVVKLSYFIFFHL